MEGVSLNILNALEDAVEKFISDFEGRMPDANQEILDELNSFIGSLDKTGGNIRASVKNLKAIDKYRNSLDKAIKNSEYSDATKEFISNFEKSTAYIDAYFGTIVAEFGNNDELYKAILQANVDTTTETLLGSGLQANFKEPIIKILKDNVISGSDLKSARAVLKEYILGNKEIDPKLTRYVSQVANDSIRQFNRNYTKAISDDLNLPAYYYKGTKIKDTRPFCTARTGRYFKKEEVEKWASQSWQGKNPSTTSQTIFIYCGGFNCRHDLAPVSEELYERAQKNGQIGLR
jgi:hypothetical protein